MADQPDPKNTDPDRSGVLEPPPFAMTDTVEVIAVMPDGRSVLCEDRHYRVFMFDLQGQPIWNLPEQRFHVALSPDGKTFVGHELRGRLHLYAVASGKPFAVWTSDPFAHYLGFARDGETLVTIGSREPHFTTSIDYTFYCWEYPSGRLRSKFQLRQASVYDVALFPAGDRIAWGDSDNAINVWDCVRGEPVLKIQEHVPGYRHLALSPDGRYLATGGLYNRACLWDAATGQLVRELQCRDPDKIVHALAFSPDGRVLAAGGCECSAYLWEVATGRLLARTQADYKNIVRIAFFLDGSKVVTGHDSQSLHIWDACTGDEIGPRYAGPPEEAAPAPPCPPEPAPTEPVAPPAAAGRKRTRVKPPPGFMSVGSPEAIAIINRGRQARMREVARRTGLHSGVLGILAAIPDGTPAAAAIANPSRDAQDKFDKLLADEKKAMLEQQSGRIADETIRELLRDLDAYLAAVNVEDKFKGSLKAMLWKTFK